MTTRRPSPEERALWRAATSDVRARRAARTEPAADDALVPTRPSPPAPVAADGGPGRAGAAASGVGLDRRSAQRLKRGQMPIEARLDLHGMTQDEAHRALDRFIREMYDAGRRAVLIITGKGTREGVGVLRQAVPRWLAEARCRSYVLATEEARPQHGGAGALYVLLRRKR
jgi:DNA-nicking Smr family endonuclease